MVRVGNVMLRRDRSLYGKEQRGVQGIEDLEIGIVINVAT